MKQPDRALRVLKGRQDSEMTGRDEERHGSQGMEYLNIYEAEMRLQAGDRKPVALQLSMSAVVVERKTLGGVTLSRDRGV